MTTFVLDCSIAISWCFEDETTPDTDKILDMICEEGAFVPNLWHLEITNVLIQAEKRGRITPTAISQRLNELSLLPIKVDLETHQKAFTNIARLAQEQNLTSYDAAYLELALRRNLGIATKDKAMKKAAINLKIPLV